MHTYTDKHRQADTGRQTYKQANRQEKTIELTDTVLQLHRVATY